MPKNGRVNGGKNGNRRAGPASDPLAEIAALSETSLQETEEAIAARHALTERFLKEIEKEIAEAMKMLRHLGHPWQRGDRTEYEFMRIALDKALTSRKKERRERLLQDWRDLLELRERRIEMMREAMALGAAGGSRSQKKEE